MMVCARGFITNNYVLLEIKQSIFCYQSSIILRIEHNLSIFFGVSGISKSIKCQFSSIIGKGLGPKTFSVLKCRHESIQRFNDISSDFGQVYKMN